MKTSNIILVILIGLLVWYYWPKKKKPCCAGCAAGAGCDGEQTEAGTGPQLKRGIVRATPRPGVNFVYDPVKSKWMPGPPNIIDEDLASFYKIPKGSSVIDEDLASFYKIPKGSSVVDDDLSSF